MMKSMMDKDIANAIGNLDEWIPYPCALGEEVMDVRENEAWLIYDRQRAIDVEMGKEVAAMARSQRDGLSGRKGALNHPPRESGRVHKRAGASCTMGLILA